MCHNERLKGFVYVSLGEQAAVNCSLEAAERASALQVEAGLYGYCACGGGVLGNVVSTVYVIDGSAVGNHVAVEAPLVPEGLRKEEFASRCAVAENAVVCTHYYLYLSILHKPLKGWQIGFIQVLERRYGIVAVACGFRSGVYCKVFCAGGGLKVERIVSLDSLHVCGTHRSCQERILSVGFHSASPPWIPENVDVGGPEGKACIPAVVTHSAEHVKLGAPLVRNHVSNFLYQFRVECGSQADWLGKYGGLSASGNSVKGFAPPVVRLYSKPFDSRSAVHHHTDFLVQGHLRNDLHRLAVHCSFL